jgi:molybdate transport system permease protein
MLSLRIAVVATVVVFCLGAAAAWAMVKLPWRGKGVAEALFTLPLVVPPTVTGFLLLVLLGKKGPVGRLLGLAGVEVIFTWWAGVIASSVVAFPLMYNAARAGLQSVDETLEKAARTLGASELRVFFTVTLPLAWPGLLAGLVLSFARALGEFGATLMVAGNIPGKTQTVPTAIWTAAEVGDMATAGALVGIMLLFGFGTTWASRAWSEGRFAKHVRARRE